MLRIHLFLRYQQQLRDVLGTQFAFNMINKESIPIIQDRDKLNVDIKVTS